VHVAQLEAALKQARLEAVECKALERRFDADERNVNADSRRFNAD